MHSPWDRLYGLRLARTFCQPAASGLSRVSVSWVYRHRAKACRPRSHWSGRQAMPSPRWLTTSPREGSNTYRGVWATLRTIHSGPISRHARLRCPLVAIKSQGMETTGPKGDDPLPSIYSPADCCGTVPHPPHQGCLRGGRWHLRSSVFLAQPRCGTIYRAKPVVPRGFKPFPPRIIVGDMGTTCKIRSWVNASPLQGRRKPLALHQGLERGRYV